MRRLLQAAAGSNSSALSPGCESILANASLICASDPTDEVVSCLAGDPGAGLFGSYLVFWRCTAHESPLALIVLVPWLLMLLLALGSTADSFLMPQLHLLSELLRLSPDVAGVTLLAVGNGAPDVFSAIAVATGNVNAEMDLSLMLSDIIGGTLFIMTVVVGAVVWVAGSRAPGWTIGRLPFWRDTLALLLAVSAVLKVAHDGKILLWEAIGFLCLHVAYIATVLLLPKVNARCRARMRVGSLAYIHMHHVSCFMFISCSCASMHTCGRACELARGAAAHEVCLECTRRAAVHSKRGCFCSRMSPSSSECQTTAARDATPCTRPTREWRAPACRFAGVCARASLDGTVRPVSRDASG